MERKLSDELKTYVFVAKQMIPKKLCSEIVKNNFKIDDSWGIHSWSSYENGKLESSIKKTQEDGLLVKKLVEEEIRSCVMRTIELYSEVYNIPKIINFVTEARINRYIEGTEMKIHHDHIHSLFDGEQKGIPILSVVGVLNDDYEGGDFIFYDALRFDCLWYWLYRSLAMVLGGGVDDGALRQYVRRFGCADCRRSGKYAAAYAWGDDGGVFFYRL